MRHKITTAITFILVLAVAGPGLGEELKVKVSKSEGKVQVCKTETSGCKSVKSGVVLPLGAVLKTAAGASCMLKWSTGHVVKVGPLSAVKLNKAALKNGAENTELELKKGNVHARAQKLSKGDSSFNIKTPTAVAGVRGTDFFAGLDDAGAIDIGVVEGSIVVSGDGFEIFVDEGLLFAIDEAGNYSDPIPLPPQVVQELKQEVQELKQEEAKDFGEVGSDEESEDSEEASGDEEDQEESDAEQDEEDTGADTETDAEVNANEDMAMDDVEVPDDVADDILGVIDTAIENAINEEIVSDAQTVYETGSIDVIITIEPQ